ncbi:hypothetical protein NP493_513g00004 [Ridgeia piscesae]|uniref:Uncharacterized protein n=1 Tax=Ridgeia piscesae TaxID=27915 RepID=A0AAD9KX90_RIDPI|nr:hypothetical protein NP493_513g00004 [Ridgeia piscesae]
MVALRGSAIWIASVGDTLRAASTLGPSLGGRPCFIPLPFPLPPPFLIGIGSEMALWDSDMPGSIFTSVSTTCSLKKSTSLTVSVGEGGTAMPPGVTCSCSNTKETCLACCL